MLAQYTIYIKKILRRIFLQSNSPQKQQTRCVMHFMNLIETMQNIVEKSVIKAKIPIIHEAELRSETYYFSYFIFLIVTKSTSEISSSARKSISSLVRLNIFNQMMKGQSSIANMFVIDGFVKRPDLQQTALDCTKEMCAKDAIEKVRSIEESSKSILIKDFIFETESIHEILKIFSNSINLKKISQEHSDSLTTIIDEATIAAQISISMFLTKEEQY